MRVEAPGSFGLLMQGGGASQARSHGLYMPTNPSPDLLETRTIPRPDNQSQLDATLASLIDEYRQGDNIRAILIEKDKKRGHEPAWRVVKHYAEQVVDRDRYELVAHYTSDHFGLLLQEDLLEQADPNSVAATFHDRGKYSGTFSDSESADIVRQNTRLHKGISALVDKWGGNPDTYWTAAANIQEVIEEKVMSSLVNKYSEHGDPRKFQEDLANDMKNHYPNLFAAISNVEATFEKPNDYFTGVNLAKEFIKAAHGQDVIDRIEALGAATIRNLIGSRRKHDIHAPQDYLFTADADHAFLEMRVRPLHKGVTTVVHLKGLDDKPMSVGAVDFVSLANNLPQLESKRAGESLQGKQPVKV